MSDHVKNFGTVQHFVRSTLLLFVIVLHVGCIGASICGAVEDWEIFNVAGTGTAGSKGDNGPAIEAELNNPFGVIRGPDGCIWFCEYSGNLVRRIDTQGVLTTVVGNGSNGYRGDGGNPLQASLNLPHEIRFGLDGLLYIADMGNHVIRRVDFAADKIETVAGTGSPGYSGDNGPAIQANLKQPHSIQFGPDGRLYICDIGNHAVRVLDLATGMISTFAGGKGPGPTEDGSPIRDTPINGPRSLDFDSRGDLWIATREGNQVFRVDMTSSRIWHIAGTGEKGFSGHGGAPKQSKLSGPKGIAIDSQGRVWLADTESHSVRRISHDGRSIDLIAGTGEAGDGPAGPALGCRLNRLHGIYVDRDNSVLIGDSESHRIRELRIRK